MWKSHRVECDKLRAKAGEKKKTKQGKEGRAVKLKKSVAKDVLGDVWSAHDRNKQESYGVSTENEN